MYKTFLILGLCVPLIACAAASDPPAPATASTSAPRACGLASGTLLDDKARYGAEALYNVPANAYVNADATGKLSPGVKARVKQLLMAMYDGLKLARSAHKAGDACGFAENVSALKVLQRDIMKLLPGPT